MTADEVGERECQAGAPTGDANTAIPRQRWTSATGIESLKLLAERKASLEGLPEALYAPQMAQLWTMVARAGETMRGESGTRILDLYTVPNT